MSHAPRIPYFKLAPKAFQALYDLSNVIKKGSLAPRLVDLVFLRVSQINGCGYCIDMHWADLILKGEVKDGSTINVDEGDGALKLVPA